jgi:hypothetical protein
MSAVTIPTPQLHPTSDLCLSFLNYQVGVITCLCAQTVVKFQRFASQTKVSTTKAKSDRLFRNTIIKP